MTDKTLKQLFESGSILQRSHDGHVQFLMNEETFIEIVKRFASHREEMAFRKGFILGVDHAYYFPMDGSNDDFVMHKELSNYKTLNPLI